MSFHSPKRAKNAFNTVPKTVAKVTVPNYNRFDLLGLLGVVFMGAVKFGYCRVSTREQNLDRQVEALLEQGVERGNIFTDKVSGVKESRPGLDDMLSRLREGDTVVVLSFDRLARSVKQLLEYVERFKEMGVDLVSVHEKIDTSTPQGKLFFTISAAFAEFEREILKQRQAEGIAVAKEQGRIKGRPKANNDKVEQAVTLYQSGNYSVSKIVDMVGISRNTLYRALNERGLTSCRA